MAPPVTIILPCFNESARIAATIGELHAWFGPDVDLLAIDDGSTDETFGRLSALAAEGRPVRVHRLPRNRGKGARSVRRSRWCAPNAPWCWMLTSHSTARRWSG